MAVQYLRLVNDSWEPLMMRENTAPDTQRCILKNFWRGLLGNNDKLEDNFIFQRSMPNASDRECGILVTRTLSSREQHEMWPIYSILPNKSYIVSGKGEMKSLFPPIKNVFTVYISTWNCGCPKFCRVGLTLNFYFKITNIAKIKVSHIQIKLMILSHMTIHLNKESENRFWRRHGKNNKMLCLGRKKKGIVRVSVLESWKINLSKQNHSVFLPYYAFTNSKTWTF